MNTAHLTWILIFLVLEWYHTTVCHRIIREWIWKVSWLNDGSLGTCL